MTLPLQQKWTCDADGNWHQVWVAVRQVNGRLIEVAEREV